MDLQRTKIKYLRSHPSVRASFSSHVSMLALKPCNSKVCHLDNLPYKYNFFFKYANNKVKIENYPLIPLKNKECLLDLLSTVEVYQFRNAFNLLVKH